jgi:hypothetical protein
MIVYLEDIKYNNIYLLNKANNKFVSVLYSTPHYTINGLYINITEYVINGNKIEITVPNKIKELERYLINKYGNRVKNYKNINNKIIINSNTNPDKIIINIYGIWESIFTYGLLYKIIQV